MSWNNLPKHILTEAQDEESSNEEACVNEFIVQETTMAEEMAMMVETFKLLWC
jgi:hypothetical protein